LNYCSIEILTIINHYFWIIFVLDIISLIYGLYLVFTNPSQSSTQNTNNSTTSNDLSVSFNLLKNKINTLLDRKNDLTITHINTPYQNTSQSSVHTQLPTPPPTNTHQYNNQEQFNIDNSKRMSTPISQLNKQKQQKQGQNPQHQQNPQHKQNPQHQHNPQHQQNNIDINIPDLDISSTSSTPINLIRTRIGSTNPDGLSSGFPEPIINEDVYAESVAGSDVASVMDLDDFEKSL